MIFIVILAAASVVANIVSIFFDQNPGTFTAAAVSFCVLIALSGVLNYWSRTFDSLEVISEKLKEGRPDELHMRGNAALDSLLSAVRQYSAVSVQATRDMEKKLAEYNQKFAQLEKASEGIVAEYVRQGQEAKARILKEAEAAADKLQAQAQKNIESEIQRVRARLQEEILDKALVKAEALVKEKVNAADQEKLVDEYLAKVVAS